jgi:CelD/BcsL family acetyltransferase involved in cellulose biosynthesis
MEVGKVNTVEVQRCDDISQLLRDWESLFELSEATCFQSIYWVRAWIKCYQPDFKVLRVWQGDELLGMALVVMVRKRTKLGFTSNSLYFQQTGDSVLDQIWVEYNGVLCKKGTEDSVTQVVGEYLRTSDFEWDELCLGTVRVSFIKKLKKCLDLRSLIRHESPSYGVSLVAVRESGKTYLEVLSRNTRYQIRRSIKLYEIEGETLEVVRAVSEQQAEQFFLDAGEYHKKRWGRGSGFHNEHFIRFHCELISDSHKAGFVDILKIKCGSKVLGYLYNLCCNGVVYFYLSGLSECGTTKLKPGLTAHALAIEYYKEKGMRFYDFMGGDGQYKKSLGEAHETLIYADLRKDRLMYRMENKLSQFKERFLL